MLGLAEPQEEEEDEDWEEFGAFHGAASCLAGLALGSVMLQLVQTSVDMPNSVSGGPVV